MRTKDKEENKIKAEVVGKEKKKKKREFVRDNKK